MLKNSLESKICLLIAGLLFALLLVIGQFQLSSQRSSILEEKMEKYQSISRLFAIACRQINVNDEHQLYSRLADTLVSSDEDVTYILVAGSNSKILYANVRNRTSAEKARLVGRDLNKVTAEIRESGLKRDSGTEKIALPILTSHKSHRTVVVGFRPISAAYAIDVQQARLLAAFAIAFIAGILGSIAIAKAMLQPIRELTKAANMVAAGDLNANVEVTSDDEVGQLGEAFNYMVEAVRVSRERLIQRANTDSLTDLFNHRYFQERLGAELSRASRYQHPLSAILLDVDNFKNLNDTYGHPFGDLVLQQIAKVLLLESRDIDVVARYGGEEFAIILPETKVTEAIVVADRLRAAVQNHSFVYAEGRSVPVTISLGVSQYPAHSTEREGLVMAADLAMYQSKTMGRNRVTAYTEDIQSSESSDPYKLYLLLHARDFGTIEAMAAAVDAKSQRQPGFSLQVMKHCMALAEEMGLSDADKGDVRIAGLLHDIGKLGVPESILTKHDALTEEEVRLIKSHSALGYAIVQKSPHLQSMLPGILYHHERWDGTGYPNGLKGEDIPMIARIISIVDAFHAMTADRPYKGSVSLDEAKSELCRCAGAQFAPEVVEAFMRVLEREAEGSTIAA